MRMVVFSGPATRNWGIWRQSDGKLVLSRSWLKSRYDEKGSNNSIVQPTIGAVAAPAGNDMPNPKPANDFNHTHMTGPKRKVDGQ